MTVKKILHPFTIVVLCLSLGISAQKKEKIKGSRLVTVKQLDITDFTSVEVDDEIEVFLSQGDKCAAEIEADDNLHDVFVVEESDSNLRLSLAKNVVGAKKVAIKITFTNQFKVLLAKGDTYITALTEMNVSDFTFKMHDQAKVFATVKATQFSLMQNDKSKIELNLTAEQAALELSRNAQIKALITASALKADLYQKASATIEGDVNTLRLRLDGNANFTGKNLTAQQADVTAEGSAQATVMAVTGVALEIAGKSALDLYGDPKIEIRKFLDNASLQKKNLKN